jgi:type II secretory pathway component PulF
MNTEEFAFVNQQLAAMLREGLPLEGSLRQLCSTMQRGALRTELERLEADLSAGVPLDQAVTERRLPELYVRLLQAGARGQDLPGVLTLLADYYRQAHGTWVRLQGLLVYPGILLLMSLLFSVWLGVLFSRLGDHLRGTEAWWNALWWTAAGNVEQFDHLSHLVHVWLPTLLIGVCALIAGCVALIAPLRRELNWRLPAFKQANLARVASALAILLRGGQSLRDALPLIEELERGTSAGRELRRWRERCEEGHGTFADMAAESRVFPPMFIWLVDSAGEDLTAGFLRAAESYRAQAARRSEVLLHAFLPASLLFLGLIVMSQLYPMVDGLARITRFFSM